MSASLPVLALVGAIVGHAVAVAYWGGRIAATLQGLAERVNRLEDTLHHNHTQRA